MPELIPDLAVNDLSIFDGRNQVIGCSSKMLADGYSIIGYCSDFHGVSSTISNRYLISENSFAILEFESFYRAGLA
jgi:hypothetical protein